MTAGIVLTAALLLGLLGTAVVVCLGLRTAARRRRYVLAAQLRAEAELEAVTRATLAAMRQVVREQLGGRRS